MKTIIFFLFFNLFNAAYAITDLDIMRDNIPKEFFSLISPNTNKPIESYEVDSARITETFNKKDGSYYLIVNYSAYDLLVKLIVFKVEKKGSFKIVQDVAEKIKITDYSEFMAADLDGDGVNEIIKQPLDDRGNIHSNYIFKWNKKTEELVDITPLRNDGDGIIYSLLTNMEVSKFKVNGKPYIINGLHYGDEYYLLDNNSNFVLDGRYNYAFISEKINPKLLGHQETVDLKRGAGTYKLIVKNISDHKHAVRAEISVNGNIVLKPEDFCTEKPKKKFEKKKDAKGKFVAEEDDDDQDEDGCKRCQFKKDVTVDVKMNDTNNVIVKLYGNKHSRVLVGFDKKD